MLHITTLSENTSGMGDFLAEWGLSILVETDTTRILLDAGTSISTVHNADSMGIDLSKIDVIVLSHGHFDHTGGLREVLRRIRRKIDVFAHPDIWQLKYHRRKNDPERFIGIPFRREELESLGANFKFFKEPILIADNVLTTGEVPMVTDYEKIDSGLFIKTDSGFQPDPVMDDLAIVIQTGQGLVVVLGCAHRGMINTLYHAREISGISTIHTVIGGSHLIEVSEERLWQSIAALKELKVQNIGLCHCTDLPAISVLAQEFRQDFLFNKAGTKLDLP